MSTSSPRPESPFSEQLQEFDRFVFRLVERVLNLIFGMTLAGGILRTVVFLLGLAVVWLFMALTTGPFETFVLQGMVESLRKTIFFFTNPNPLYSLVEGAFRLVIYYAVLRGELIRSLFNAGVLRHVVPIAVTYFVAFRIATFYLKDIFELEHEGVASRFIRQTAFALSYHRLIIKNGVVSNKESPIFLIGGPGIVQVHMENVAIFEKPSGEVHIIGQKSGKNLPSNRIEGKPGKDKRSDILDGFERLRDVIDLRNQRTQENELDEVDGRTRDGIRIKAKNVLIDFSLQRDVSGSQASFAANPYTYQEEGLKALVYQRSHGMDWTGIMKGMVRKQLQEFIAERRLSEFLAVADFPSLANSGPLLNFISRQELTEFFESHRFKQYAATMGMQLNWIDVGTWMAPDVFNLVTRKNLEAWEITVQNETRRKTLPSTVKESRLAELSRLVREVPLVMDAEERDKDQTDEDRKINLIFGYLGMLRSAQADLVHRAVPNSPDLDAAINFLSTYLKDYQVRAGKYRFI